VCYVNGTLGLSPREKEIRCGCLRTGCRENVWRKRERKLR